MPDPLMTRLTLPKVPPPEITPEKVLEPLAGAMVKTDAVAAALLSTVPAPLSEPTCWLAEFKSSVELAATVRAVVLGNEPA